MKIKKKYAVGTARVFISRSRVLRKLQLSLNEFRRLCILKGVYPREPLHVKKANKGGTQNRIYYHLRDIQHLAREPLIQQFRAYKIFLRKLTRAKARREGLKAKSLSKNKPVFRLDAIIRERYPTFTAALKDLDDALCVCFAFSSLTPSKVARPSLVANCKRLTTEFMHYVIESKSLRKVFISIKGIYYQAEILGESITWIVGHERAVGRANELDFTVMKDFADFYTTMLAFVNFRLYKSLGLFYPPRLSRKDESTSKEGSQFAEEQFFSLNCAIERSHREEDIAIDTFPETTGNGSSDQADDFAAKIQSVQRLKNLFVEQKFFLNREVPKDPLTFIIRACGGSVSWEGSPPASDASSREVTHQVVDRPMSTISTDRVYVQPQWIFDSFNARQLLPSEDYAPGAVLPPHFSPFVEEKPGDYIPPERIAQLKRNGHHETIEVTRGLAPSSDSRPTTTKATKAKASRNEASVRPGKAFRVNSQQLADEKGHDRKLRELMIRKKHRRVYKKIRFGEKRRAQETTKLKAKRVALDNASSAKRRSAAQATSIIEIK